MGLNLLEVPVGVLKTFLHLFQSNELPFLLVIINLLQAAARLTPCLTSIFRFQLQEGWLCRRYKLPILATLNSSLAISSKYKDFWNIFIHKSRIKVAVANLLLYKNYYRCILKSFGYQKFQPTNQISQFLVLCNYLKNCILTTLTQSSRKVRAGIVDT